jgi:transposase
MGLHANAALSWSGRRRLCELVVEDGWTVVAAAAACGVSVRCARKWIGRYRLEGSAGLRDRSSAPRRVANRTAGERVEAIIKLRRLRFTAAEIAEALGMALSTVSGDLDSQRDGQAWAARARAAGAVRAVTTGRARPHRREEARPDQGRRRLADQRHRASPLHLPLERPRR